MSKTTQPELTAQERDFIRVALDFYVENHARVRRPQAIRVKSLLHSERDPLAIDDQARSMARRAVIAVGETVTGYELDPEEIARKLEVPE